MSITFPLVSPIPYASKGASAGTVIVGLEPGATPTYIADAKTMTLVMTMSEPNLFSLASNSPLTSITYKDGVCTVSGPPMYVLPTMLEGVKFTYDMRKDISKAKIMVSGHDGSASFSQTLTFQQYDTEIKAVVAAARRTTFTIGVPSPFPSIALSDVKTKGNSDVVVTIIPEVPSALTRIGTKEASGASVHVNTVTKAGRAKARNFLNTKGAVNVEDDNVVSIAFRGSVHDVNMAMANANFVAMQAIGSNTSLTFTILVADKTSTIFAQRITLNGIPESTASHTPPVAPPKNTDESGYPIYGSMDRSLVPPPAKDGHAYTIQVLNGTPTWVPTSVKNPVIAADVMPTSVTTTVLAPFTSIFSSKTDSEENQKTVLQTPPPAPSATASSSSSSSFSTLDRVIYALVLILCLILFALLGYVTMRDFNDEA